jgi:DNA-binding CsgD family transcriptional regulator
MSYTLNLKPNTTPRLSQREKETLYLIAFEYNNKEIAKILYLSPDTIDSHRKRLMSKLGVCNSAGLISKAYQYNILPMQAPSSEIANINHSHIIRLSTSSVAS